MLSNEQLYDKVLACWMGKNIGGALGGPTEGRCEKLCLTDLPDIGKNGPMPNDDLDLQLVNLHVLEQRGADITLQDLSEEWLEHVFFPYDEYGYSLTNLRRGMQPPFSGWFNNPFTDCMGSPIRSELWASVAPGRPEVAAYYAWQDAMVDHAGGEGVCGEMFFAALQSLAYVDNDFERIVDKAMAYLPEDSRTARVLRDTFRWYREGVSYDDIRDRILEGYGNGNFTDCPQNIAFTAVGLLYGHDFKDAMLKAVNCGYDTDCTGATLGALYGILYGTAGIPREWAAAVGENITVSPEVFGINTPRTIRELTDRTLAVKAQVDALPKTDWSIPTLPDYNRQIFFITGGSTQRSLTVTVTAAEELVCVPGNPKTLHCTVRNTTDGLWDCQLRLAGGGETVLSERLTLEPGEERTAVMTVPVAVTPLLTADYTLSVLRYHNDRLWMTYDRRLALPVYALWTVDGSPVYGRDCIVTVAGAGKHRLRTTLTLPEEREVKLMLACSETFTAYLDGQEIVRNEQPVLYRPAYHCGQKHLRRTVTLTPGAHEFTVELDSTLEQCPFAVMPTAPDWTTRYWSYYLIDCGIGLPETK